MIMQFLKHPSMGLLQSLIRIIDNRLKRNILSVKTDPSVTDMSIGMEVFGENKQKISQ